MIYQIIYGAVYRTVLATFFFQLKKINLRHDFHKYMETTNLHQYTRTFRRNIVRVECLKIKNDYHLTSGFKKYHQEDI